MNIVLRAKSNKAKTIIREHGKVYKVLSTSDKVQALNNQPGMLIENGRDKRWIHTHDDPHFTYLEIIE